jgi:hypothetical protein
MKYFHEISNEEYKALEQSGAKWNEVMEEYNQPVWCDYPDALAGAMGCYSLTLRTGVSLDYCHNCDCCVVNLQNGIKTS